MKSIFEFVVPPFLRKRRAMEDEEIIAALAKLTHQDAGTRALLTVVADQFEQEMAVLLSAKLRQSRVEYQRGRAAALYALVDRIEAAREEAREVVEAERKRQEQEMGNG